MRSIVGFHFFPHMQSYANSGSTLLKLFAVMLAAFSTAAFASALLPDLAQAAEGASCGTNYWPGTLPEQEVDSVGVSGLQSFLAKSPAIEGIEYTVTKKGDEIWLDVVRYPGQVSIAVSIRTLFVIGRIVRPEYKTLVLSDAGVGVFEIPYDDIHAIGCQFLWGTQGGQNPIALTRQLADHIRNYPSETRVAPPFNGSLLGDTSATLATLNGIVYPRWVMKTVEIK